MKLLTALALLAASCVIHERLETPEEVALKSDMIRAPELGVVVSGPIVFLDTPSAYWFVQPVPDGDVLQFLLLTRDTRRVGGSPGWSRYGDRIGGNAVVVVGGGIERAEAADGTALPIKLMECDAYAEAVAVQSPLDAAEPWAGTGLAVTFHGANSPRLVEVPPQYVRGVLDRLVSESPQ